MSLHEKAKGYYGFYKRSIILKFQSRQCERSSMKVTKITPISEKDSFDKVSFSRVFQRKRKTYNGGSKVRKWCKDKFKLPRNKLRITFISKKTTKVRSGLRSQLKPRGKLGRFRFGWRVLLGVGFQRRTMVVYGGYWWLWVMEKELGKLEMVLEERRRRKWLFSKATRKAKAETLKCFCSRRRKRFSQARRWIKDRNGPIMDI